MILRPKYRKIKTTSKYRSGLEEQIAQQLELKNINFPENFSLPNHINDQTIGTFIESIRSVDISI